MNTLNFLFPIWLWLLACFSLKPALAQKHTFILRGHLNTPTQAARIYLDYTDLRVPGKPDSAWVRNGYFEFKGTVSKPQTGLLSLVPPGKTPRYPYSTRNHVFLYLEKGTITIVSADSLDNAVANGTPLNEDATRIQAIDNAYSEQLLALHQKVRDASPADRESPAFKAKLDTIYYTALAIEQKALTNYIKNHPQSLVSIDALMLLNSSKIGLEVVEPLYNGLAPAVRVSERGLMYARDLNEIRRTSIGAMAPDFTQTDFEGRPVKLSDFRGKYVLLDFWASWCGPCRQENPNVLANYRRYKEHNFTVLGVSLDRATQRKAWLKAIATDSLTWPQVADLDAERNGAAALYDVTSIPQNFLIGPNGRIIARNLRGEELGRKLAAVLSGAPATSTGK